MEPIIRLSPPPPSTIGCNLRELLSPVDGVSSITMNRRSDFFMHNLSWDNVFGKLWDRQRCVAGG